MMKLIVNSLYRNKEIFLRELISNASDALDKIRLLSLTSKEELNTNPDLNIKIKMDKDNKILHIMDSGIGMSKDDLINNLGTIAKSGTADFLSKMQDPDSTSDLSDMIGQFGVGFYSAFLVADRVIVTSKHNSDEQYVWESDANSFSIIKDPRGDTLKRGSIISLKLKDEASDFLQEDTVKNLIQKYSQFINFPIYLWSSTEVEVDEEVEEADSKPSSDETDDEANIWTKSDNIKLFVRRVFITDEFNDIMPNFLNFIRGIVDSDDLPLNVSRETLQQHKLIKVLKKKIVRKVLDMIGKIDKDAYKIFWKEYSTNIKLGLMEDAGNRARLAKLLRFQSSSNDFTSLTEYVERAKENQEHIYYIAGSSKAEVTKSPFVERLLKNGYEVLYLTEAVDEYCISSLPEFDGKKFQNVAKEGFKLPEETSNIEELKSTFEPLTKWLFNVALKDLVLKVEISERLYSSPAALVAGMFSWTGNMERLAMSNAHQKSDDSQRSYYLNQKKIFEINPHHQVIRELLRRMKVMKMIHWH
uniref:Heat shock protein 83 n=1 Tax=Megaselia scalaris TaxID=36166 RepID=T1GLU0_MEGSC